MKEEGTRKGTQCRASTHLNERERETRDELYKCLDEDPINAVLMKAFTRKIEERLRTTSKDIDDEEEDAPRRRKGAREEDGSYTGMLELAKELEAAPNTRSNTLHVLKSLFPSFLPVLFKRIIAENAPRIAGTMNALATFFTCQWLMGPMQVRVKVSGDNYVHLKSKGTTMEDDAFTSSRTEEGKEEDESKTENLDAIVFVERCRYLEESQCVSVCVNTCKRPTQDFFNDVMGVKMTMVPDYSDYSCRFNFGISPPENDEDDEALASAPACFATCSRKAPACVSQCPHV